MATRLMNSSSKIKLLVYRTQGLKIFSSQHFSSQNSGPRENCSDLPPKPTEVSAGSPRSWLNIRAGIFGPDDERLPLPGDVGLSQHLNSQIISATDCKPLSLPSSEQPFSLITNQEKQFENIHQTQQQIETSWKMFDEKLSDADSALECRVQECPDLLKKDFLNLFPDIGFLRKQQLAVISLCQKTLNDMCGWSEDTEIERETLIEQFITDALKICDALRAEGYWADFIDPTCGRPYLGAFTNATFFETDERYRHFGFAIDDLGCCKVITHRAWGSHVFVGAVFTNAPVESVAIEDSLSFYKARFSS